MFFLENWALHRVLAAELPLLMFMEYLEYNES